jgi:hypothetical protein
VHHNGQLGVNVTRASGSQTAPSTFVEHNELAGNNYAGYDQDWEAGGGKFAYTTDLTLQRNWVHDNNGAGLWTDIDNRGSQIIENLATDNDRSGIWHEISYDAIIEANTVLRNGLEGAGNPFRDLYEARAGIFISSSGSDSALPLRVADNVVRGNRHGIVVVSQGDGVSDGDGGKRNDAVPVDGVEVADNLIDSAIQQPAYVNDDGETVASKPGNGFTGFSQDFIEKPICRDPQTSQPRQCTDDELAPYRSEVRQYFSTGRVDFVENDYRTNVGGDVASTFLGWCNGYVAFNRWLGVPQDETGTLNGSPDDAKAYSCDP